ncbi:serine/threonine-protein kinase [Actinoplanes sp. NPDC051633]|uniref:serine/threonine-protein kinase n=1 Tax=Actinoplanes sp. NPDC051633 TaxID=3155670 RepID=UPI003427F2EB
MSATETLVAGRYRVGPCLGKGGMGRVWLARDEVLRRDVAIKEIALPFGLTDEEREEMRARTLREARAAARLNHPNVVRIYDVQHGDERPWIVMEYVPARSLLQVIKENGPLPPAEVAGIGLAVLSALDAAQRVGVVHRDIKPSNVLVADDGRVLLTDFGSALIDEGEGALTQTGLILGSPRYIAPERAANGVSTLESDLWSLGATLYEAVEGRAPYTRETTMAVLVALATEKPDPTHRAGALKPVLNGLLQKNPRSRMRLDEVEERLRRIADVQNAVRLHNVPSPPARGQAAPPAPTPPPMAREIPGNVDLVNVAPIALAAGPEVPGTSTDSRSAAPAAVPAPIQRPAPVEPPRRRPVAQLVVGVATAATLVVGTAAFAANGGSLPWSDRDGDSDGDRTAVAATANPTPAASSAPAPTSAATPAPVSTVLPSAFKWYDSRSGFHVAWPKTWVKVQESRTSVTLCAPGGPPVVAVREWTRSDPDLTAALRREETAAALPRYKRERMVVSPQQDSAEWEYTFTDPKMGALHGLERAVLVGGRAYLIQWRTPAGEWAKHQSALNVVVNSFRPAPPPAAVNQTVTPSGFVAYQSGTGGFQLAAPAKWAKVKETATSVVFCAPGGPPLVGVRTWAPSNENLAVALTREAALAKLPGYREISVENLPGGQGAVWEYTFTDPKMGRLHGLERAFVTPTGGYLVQWRTPADKWAANLPKLGVIASSFRAA